MKHLILFFALFITIIIKGQNLVVFNNNQYSSSDNNIQFQWSAFPVCSNFNIEMATDDEYINIIYRITTPQNQLSYTFLSAGKYFIRVKSVCMNEWQSIQLTILNTSELNNELNTWLSSDNNIVVNSNKVSKWINRTNINIYAEQTNANLRPNLINAEPLLNSKPVLFFKPISQISYLDLNAIQQVDSVTVVAVYAVDVNNNSGLQYFLSATNNPNGYFAESDNGNEGFGIISSDGVTNTKIVSNITSVDSLYSIYTVSNNYIKKNNNLLSSIGSLTHPFIYQRIGSRNNNNNLNFRGKVAEIMIFNKILDDVKIDLIHNYLFTKYAPPVYLGSDIVYGSTFSDSYTIDASPRFVKYLWSTGDTTQTIQVQNCGTYSIITTDVFGRTSTDEIQVYPYNRLNNDTLYICEGDSITIPLNSNSSLNKLWSNGSTADSIIISNEGTYTVSITDINNKTIVDTITVLFDKISLSNLPNNQTLNGCLFEKINLTNNVGLDSILWSDNSTATNYTITNNEFVKVYAKSYAGCIYNDSFNINIIGQKPSVDFNIPNALCIDQPINFQDFSFAPPGDFISTWDWTFGDGNTSDETNPVNTYNDILSYNVQLKVTTDKTCTDSIAKSIQINPKPTPNFYNLLSCSGNPTSFIDQSQPRADSISSWNWNFNNLGTSTQQNPTFAYPSVGSYQTNLTVTNSNGCYTTISKPTVVNPSPDANFNFEASCEQTPITFTNTSSMVSPFVITQWLWSFGDGNQNNLNYNVSHTYQTQGSYTAKLLVIANNQCRDTVVKTISVYDNPVVDFNMSPTQCVGSNIQFTDASTTTDGSSLNTWNWYFAGQATSNQQNPTYVFNTQGNYTIQLNAKTEHGCSGNKFKTIAVVDKPEVDFSFSPTYGLPPLNVSFNNLSPNTSTFVWDYGDGSSNYSGYNSPNHIYNALGSYPIKLTAINAVGCTDSIIKYILVDQANIDGAMVSVNILQNGNYYQVFVTVLNNSNVNIYELGLTIQLANGSIIREIWNGNLNPGETVNYPFTGQIYYNSSYDVPVICASIESVNINAVETNLDNNTDCKELSIGDFEVMSIYPNPTYGNTKFGVMIPEDGSVTVKIVDYLGKVYSQQIFEGIAGYNIFSYDLFPLGSAVYVASIEYGGETKYHKIMRIDQ